MALEEGGRLSLDPTSTLICIFSIAGQSFKKCKSTFYNLSVPGLVFDTLLSGLSLDLTLITSVRSQKFKRKIINIKVLVTNLGEIVSSKLPSLKSHIYISYQDFCTKYKCFA